MFMDFRDRLKKEIDRQGMSVLALSKKAQIGTSTIQSWFYESRRAEPTATNLFKVTNVLGVSLDYIMTGEESALADDDFLCEKKVEYRTVGGLYSGLKEEDTLLVPVVTQKLSAGHGQEFLPATSYVGAVRILKRMTFGINPETLVAAEVRGDSMTGVQISAGDMVIFSKGHIDGEGIYAISLYGDVMVKRLEFRRTEGRIAIISENPKYQPQYVNTEDDNLVIIGKVVGWVHCLS